jgi:hypothetical protein
MSRRGMLLELHSDILRLIIDRCDGVSRVMLKLTHRRLNSIILTPKFVGVGRLCRLVIEYNYMNILKYLHETYFDLTGAVMIVIDNGNLEMLKYLVSIGWTLNYDCSYRAADGGYLDILKYLFDNKCPYYQDIIGAPLEFCYFEIVDYLREQGCPFDKNTFVNEYKNTVDNIDYIYSNEGVSRGEAKLKTLISVLDYLEKIE